MIIPQYFGFFFSLLLLFILNKKSVLGNNSGTSFQETDTCECGRANTFAPRIVGGEETAPHQYPWMVAIFHNGLMHCGGSLINDRYVLTAGHCLKWATKENLTLVLGMHDRVLLEEKKEGGLLMEIEEVLVHKDFKSLKTHDVHDVGLIKLKTPVLFNEKITPVCLPLNKDETYVDIVAQVTGWGKVSESAHPSRFLREAHVKVISNDMCKKSPIIGKFILDDMMCAYKDNVDACQGDSGGPIIFETETARVEQIGVVSWGIGCASPGIPGVYARVTSYLPWLAFHTKDSIYCRNQH